MLLDSLGECNGFLEKVGVGQYLKKPKEENALPPRLRDHFTDLNFHFISLSQIVYDLRRSLIKTVNTQIY